jgi:hypothetical protein
MAYLGRPGATAPLTSADIPDNSITAAKIVDATIAAGDLAPDSVDSSELVDGSVDNSHLADDAVGIAELSATGTASATTYLRGDNSWQTAGSTSASDLDTGTLLNARLPVGAILQVVSYWTDTLSSQSIAQTDVVVNSMVKVITPEGANSKFLVAVRWFGETSASWNTGFNIQMNGTRVNSNTTASGVFAHSSYLAQAVTCGTQSDNFSTPESANFQTLVSTSSVIGTDITFQLVCSTATTAAITVKTNRVVADMTSNTQQGYERATSELIITEIKG